MICLHVFHGIYNVPILLRTVGNAFSSSSLGLKVLSSPGIVGSLLLTVNRAPKCMVMVFVCITSVPPSCDGNISLRPGCLFPGSAFQTGWSQCGGFLLSEEGEWPGKVILFWV